MPKVLFKATLAVPTWRHKKGGVRAVPYAEGETMKVVGPIDMKDGDIEDMDDFDANWCVSTYPLNFSFVDKVEEAEKPAKPSYRSKKAAKDEDE